jgi:hypothetical protein
VTTKLFIEQNIPIEISTTFSAENKKVAFLHLEKKSMPKEVLKLFNICNFLLCSA